MFVSQVSLGGGSRLASNSSYSWPEMKLFPNILKKMSSFPKKANRFIHPKFQIKCVKLTDHKLQELGLYKLSLLTFFPHSCLSSPNMNTQTFSPSLFV